MGTAPFLTALRWPGAAADLTPETIPETTPPDIARAEPWKSLILPGWGQLDAGIGAGWINLLVEAGAVALILSDETEAGFAVLGANHLVSFVDLF